MRRGGDSSRIRGFVDFQKLFLENERENLEDINPSLTTVLLFTLFFNFREFLAIFICFNKNIQIFNSFVIALLITTEMFHSMMQLRESYLLPNSHFFAIYEIIVSPIFLVSEK